MKAGRILGHYYDFAFRSLFAMYYLAFGAIVILSFLTMGMAISELSYRSSDDSTIMCIASDATVLGQSSPENDAPVTVAVSMVPYEQRARGLATGGMFRMGTQRQGRANSKKSFSYWREFPSRQDASDFASFVLKEPMPCPLHFYGDGNVVGVLLTSIFLIFALTFPATLGILVWKYRNSRIPMNLIVAAVRRGSVPDDPCDALGADDGAFKSS